MRNILAALLCALPFIAFSQFDYGCDGERYVSPVIQDVEKTTVMYGENTEPDGDLVELMMDIYQPTNDEVNGRPAIVLAHGGSFISGARQELNATCERLAAHGYVAATIDYRLLSILSGIPDSIGAMDIAVKAAHDMKAAIRWLKHSAIADGNPYNIDPNMMFCGGYSAGAITALIAGTLDIEEIDKPFLIEILENNDGIDGSTGNPEYIQYGSEVRGVLNFSGAVYDLNWLDNEDPMVVSMHGDEDETVPYLYGFVNVFYNPIVRLYGSGSMHAYMDSESIPNYLYTVEGGGHTDIYFLSSYADQLEEFNNNADTLFADIICDGIVQTILTPALDITLAPNPAARTIQFHGLKNQAMLSIYDATGKSMIISEVRENEIIDIQNLAAGIYYFTIEQDGNEYTGKFVKQ